MIYFIIGIVLFIFLLFIYCCLKLAHDADNMIELYEEKDKSI